MKQTPAHSYRAFHGDTANLALVERLRSIADARGVTVAQLAISWVLAQGQEHADIVVLLGARWPHRITEALPATELGLTDDDLAQH